MAQITGRLVEAYQQGGAAGLVRRAGLYGQRAALSAIAPVAEACGVRRATLANYAAKRDRRVGEEHAKHIAALVGLADEGQVHAAVPLYLAPALRALCRFARHDIAAMPLDLAHVEGATAATIPYPLAYALDGAFLRETVGSWGIICANAIGATLAARMPDIADGARAARERLGRELDRLDRWSNSGGYQVPGGYSLRCRRNGFDLSMIDEVWADYFGWNLEFNPADLVMDIGANLGAFTVEASRRVPEGAVIAFEPEPTNFALLRQNVEAQGRGNVILRQEAVSDRTGTAALNIDAEHTGAHSIVSPKATGTGALAVPMVAFADVVAELDRPVGVLKIDCEGAEYDVLLPAGDLLRQRVRQIVAEAQQTDRHLPADLVAFLRGIGFFVEYRGSKDLGLLKAVNRRNNEEFTRS